MSWEDDQGDPSVGEENEQVKRMIRYRERYEGMALKALVLNMTLVRARKDDVEKQLANINAEYDVLRFEKIPEKMDEDGVKNVVYEDVLAHPIRVQLAGDLRIQTLNKGGLFTWLKRRKAASIVQETVNASTLKSFLKARIKKGAELPGEDIVKITPVTRASIVKA